MKHLFIDDYELEAIDNLARKLHQPKKFRGNAVVRPEDRWENMLQVRSKGLLKTRHMLLLE